MAIYGKRKLENGKEQLMDNIAQMVFKFYPIEESNKKFEEFNKWLNKQCKNGCSLCEQCEKDFRKILRG